MLVKFKEHYAGKLLRNHRDSNEEWIKAKVEFSRAKQVAKGKREAYLDISNPTQNSKAKQVTAHDDAVGLLKLLPEMCFVRTGSGRKERRARKQDEEQVKQKALSAFETAKKRLLLAACDVVRKEMATARELEILSTMHLSMNHLKFKKARRQITLRRDALDRALGSLRSRVKAAKDRVEAQSKEAERLEKKTAPDDPPESPAQVRARRKRLERETARLCPRVAEGKVAVARRTALLLEAVQAFSKAGEVQGALMVGKSEARVRSRVARERGERVRGVEQPEAGEEEHEARVLGLALDEEDIDELDAVKEPSVADLKRQMNRLAPVPGEAARVAELQEALVQLERQQALERYQETDLNAEAQIARARVAYEAAEGALWQEWVNVATAEESDRPSQEPGSLIPAKAARADAAYKEVRALVIEAGKEVGGQDRKACRNPAYLSETPARRALASGRWEPGREVGNFAACLSRLERPAERALRMAERALDGPMGQLEAPAAADLHAELAELEAARGRLEETAAAAARSGPRSRRASTAPL